MHVAPEEPEFLPSVAECNWSLCWAELIHGLAMTGNHMRPGDARNASKRAMLSYVRALATDAAVCGRY